MKRFILVTMATFLAALGGCVTARTQPQTCALILIMDGQQVSPSLSQFEAVQRKLGTQFERQSLWLVHELRSAQLIATIECLPDLDDATRTNLIVRHIGPNTFTPIAGNVAHTTLSQPDREHAEAIRGFTRAMDISN